MVDYIIIGGGTAGAILANRLSENPENQVLLIEAGKKDKKSEIRIPAAFSKLFKTEIDWEYYSTPQEHALNRKMYLPRGKVLGGSSSINAMIYIRGNKVDYDHWSELGNKGWSYNEILPYFRKSENQENGENTYHGVNGPMAISNQSNPHPISQNLAKAAEQAGFQTNPDFNGKQQEGFGLYQVNQKNGRRVSTAEAFLKPIKRRKNLTILTETHVNRIVIENGKAIGVEYQLPNYIQVVKARKEVIICAGAYNSPQLLMVSGIGDQDELNAAGINVKQHLPGVGKNLQDHIIFPMVFHNRDKKTLEEAESLSNVIQYLIWGEGALSSNIAEAGGFVHTKKGLAGPDIQYHFAPGFFINHGFDNPKTGRGFSLGPTLMQPYSSGEVRITSDDSRIAPEIDHGYLSDPRDLETLIEGYRIGMKIIKTEAFKPYFDGYFLPGKELLKDEEIADHIKRNFQTLYHPTGTCKMGSDDMSVVNDQLMVHGIENLRVVDASIMPQIVRGNTHAPVMMIAEKAADMILEEVAQEKMAAIVAE